MTSPTLPPAVQTHAPLASRQPPEPPRWTSEALLRGAREVNIQHGGETYRLRLTSLGKLILTK